MVVINIRYIFAENKKKYERIIKIDYRNTDNNITIYYSAVLYKKNER